DAGLDLCAAGRPAGLYVLDLRTLGGLFSAVGPARIAEKAGAAVGLDRGCRGLDQVYASAGAGGRVALVSRAQSRPLYGAAGGRFRAGLSAAVGPQCRNDPAFINRSI